MAFVEKISFMERIIFADERFSILPHGNELAHFGGNETDDIVSDIEIPYAEADDSGAVMLRAVGSVMFVFLSFFLR